MSGTIIILYALIAALCIGVLIYGVFIKPYESRIKILESKVQLYQAANKIELS